MREEKKRKDKKSKKAWLEKLELNYERENRQH